MSAQSTIRIVGGQTLVELIASIGLITVLATSAAIVSGGGARGGALAASVATAAQSVEMARREAIGRQAHSRLLLGMPADGHSPVQLQVLYQDSDAPGAWRASPGGGFVLGQGVRVVTHPPPEGAYSPSRLQGPADHSPLGPAFGAALYLEFNTTGATEAGVAEIVLTSRGPGNSSGGTGSVRVRENGSVEVVR